MPHQPAQEKPVAHVLVVEDHPDIGNLMRLALARSLIEATLTTSGEEALTRLATETYDLILLDINLPGISGLDVCRQLKADEKLKAIPVIFVSAQTDKSYKDEAKRLGAVDYIEKPFDVLTFLSLVVGQLKLGASARRDMCRAWPMQTP